MKYAVVLLVVLLWGTVLRAEQSAQVRLHCISLKFGSGTSGISTLQFTTLDNGVNGELRPFDDAVHSHRTTMILDNGSLPLEGALLLTVPMVGDRNNNGWDDFFEVAQGVPASITSGEYTTFISEGTATITWSRSAGARLGSCTIRITDDLFGELGVFNPSFELLEYRGPLFYEPGVSNVIGRLELTQTGNPTSTRHGEFLCVKSIDSPANKLTWRAGLLTNEVEQTLSYEDTTLFRAQIWPTNYFANLSLADGDLQTVQPDYLTWALFIDDLNDVDGDQIPDFSDAPSLPVPLIGIGLNSTNVLLTVRGQVGHLHEILSTTSIPSADWQTNLTFTLSSNPETFSLPRPVEPTFWQLRSY